jgi:hypothetical protein
MRIIIPFARGHLEDDTVAAMQAYCPKSVRWSTVCVDEEPNIDDIWPKAHTGYHEMLAAMWGEKETTIIIEHDIVILPGVIESLLECEHDWCGNPYFVGAGVHVCLGCTKFSSRLMFKHPNMMHDAGLIESSAPAKDWHRVDIRIEEVLMQRLKIERHVHDVQVGHINDQHKGRTGPQYNVNDTAIRSEQAMKLDQGIDALTGLL